LVQAPSTGSLSWTTVAVNGPVLVVADPELAEPEFGAALAGAVGAADATPDALAPAAGTAAAVMHSPAVTAEMSTVAALLKVVVSV
jgi:hypothetical protein